MSLEFTAWFQCISGCEKRYSLQEIIYTCPTCGSLLEVEHDITLLKKRSAAEWKNLFDSRYKKSEWPYGSSVWGKRELVCPEVADSNIVSTYEGGTNLFWAERLGKKLGVEDLWIKECGSSHTGSFKDLGMTVLVSMVKEMVSNGKNIPAVACASTGDTSAALAAYCAVAGIQAIVFLPKDKVSNAQLIQPLAYGALTLSLDTDFDGCMELVQEICIKNNLYLANSMNSLRVEGQKTVSMEMVQQFEWEVPDVIIIPGGNLGNVSALGKGFKLMKTLGIIDKYPKIICAQAQNANPLYRSFKNGFTSFEPIKAKQTLASAIQIGNPVSIKKAINTLKEFDGLVEEATEDELANAAARSGLTGMFCCPHTGVALAVLDKLIKNSTIKSTDRVVVISTANGLKFTDFQLGYHEKRLQAVRSRYSNLPIELPADANKIHDVIMGAVDKKL